LAVTHNVTDTLLIL